MAADARDALIAAPDEEVLRRCDLEFTRTRGPGGQHRNKAETGVRIRHRDTGVTVTATERRSQHQNRAEALRRLRRALAVRVRAPAAGRADLPADLVARLALPHWHTLSPRSPLFWQLAARILDRLAADGARLSDSARLLGVSTASFSKFLAVDPDVWQAACRIRSAAGLPPLRR